MKKEVYYIGGIVAAVLIIIITMIALGKTGPAGAEKPSKAKHTTTAAATTAAPTTTTEPVDTTDELLTLVNYKYAVPDSWKVDLVEVQNGARMDKRAAESFMQMLKDAKAAGVHPYVRNAYRSKSTQQAVYDRKINAYLNDGYSEEEAKKRTLEWISYPGMSEHQLGLAADVVDRDYQELEEKQEETETQKWLMENCVNYGFILRYPKDKEAITHIHYEPWHYRYVGKENAKKIKDSGLCLEEYLGKAE